jgi:outer membrane protein TolC
VHSLRIVLIAATVLTGVGSAQQMPRTEFRIPARIGIFGTTPITLDDAIAQALANNGDIANSSIDRVVSRYNFTAAKGVFDPRLNFASSYEKDVIPVSSSIGGSSSGSLTQKNFVATPKLTGFLPFGGGSYQVGMNAQRVTSDNSFLTLNPQFPSSFNASIIQPLWRGLRIDDNRRRISVARKNQSLSDEQFRQRVIDVTAQTEKAYWDLVFAVRNLAVVSEGAGLARQQVESNRRMATQGILAAIDVVEAETQLSTLEQNAYSAQQGLTLAENALKTLILPNRNSPQWANAFAPEGPPPPRSVDATLEQALSEALKNRPELAQALISESIDKINTNYYRDQVRPQVDFVAAYTSAGLAGTQLVSQSNPLTSGFDVFIDRLNALSALQGLPKLPGISIGGGGGVPSNLVGGFGQSLNNLAHGRYPSASAGIQISLPIRNRVAESNLGIARAEERRAANRLRQVELQIESEVRSALQAVASTQARLNAATSARRSAEEQYSSEQRKFQAGTSTVFLVMQRQTAMIVARNGELSAQSDLGKAVADFERATSRTLSVHNINIESAASKQP